MSDTATAPSVDVDAASALQRALAELERRVNTLENKVAAMPDVRQIDERITDRVKTSLPPVPPLEDPARAPSFRDISLPMPNTQTIVATAKGTWAILEILNELKWVFWSLLDRRYHMAWITRTITIVLVILILTSHWWAPFAVYDNFVSHLWDKLIDLALGLILFLVLSFETRRYKEWRSQR